MPICWLAMILTWKKIEVNQSGSKNLRRACLSCSMGCSVLWAVSKLISYWTLCTGKTSCMAVCTKGHIAYWLQRVSVVPQVLGLISHKSKYSKILRRCACLWWLRQSRGSVGSVFKDVHRDRICVRVFIEISVHTLWVSDLYYVIKKCMVICSFSFK